MINWPTAVAIITCISIIAGVIVKFSSNKMKPVCVSEFRALDKKLNDISDAAWREVKVGKEDRIAIRQKVDSEICTAEKDRAEIKRDIIRRGEAVVRLEAEMEGVHHEVKEIKESLVSINGKIETILINLPKRKLNGRK